MRWAVIILVGCVGCSVAPSEDPMHFAWSLVGGHDEPPAIEFIDGDCGEPANPGMSVYNAEARTTYCLGGQAFSEDFVRIATWPGATTRDLEMARRIVHEFTHAQIMRTRDWYGDLTHSGPEWPRMAELSEILSSY